jgi:hypothetical protein
MIHSGISVLTILHFQALDIPIEMIALEMPLPQSNNVMMVIIWKMMGKVKSVNLSSDTSALQIGVELKSVLQVLKTYFGQ